MGTPRRAGPPYGLPAQAATGGQFWTPIGGQYSTPIDIILSRAFRYQEELGIPLQVCGRDERRFLLFDGRFWDTVSSSSRRVRLCHLLRHRRARNPALFTSYACDKMAEDRRFLVFLNGVIGLLNRRTGSTRAVSSNLIPSTARI
jgi:hypothetical protein